MAGNLVIDYREDGSMKVDFSGNSPTATGLHAVELIKAVMAIESLAVAQTDMGIADIREMIDEERATAVVVDDTKTLQNE